MQMLAWWSANWAPTLWIVIIFGLMIFIHEFGHFIVAKALGVRVIEFAMGFGKKLVAFRGGDTEYSLRLFPLGGYVKMVGEGEAGDPDDPGNFQNKSVGARIAIIAAGPLMNCVLAFVLLVSLGLFLGRIQPTLTTEVHQVRDDKPAARAGIVRGDRIVAVNGAPVDLGEKVMEIIQRSEGKEIVLLVDRGGARRTVTLTPVRNPETGKGIIGVGFKPVSPPAFASPGIGAAVDNVTVTFATVGLMPIKVIQMLLSKEMQWKDVKEGSAGPIGIGQFIFEAATAGAGHLLWVAGILNVAIGFFNLYPIPALDGARIAFLGLGVVLRKPINPEKEEFVHFLGFVLLILLVLVVSYQDVLRLIQGKKLF